MNELIRLGKGTEFQRRQALGEQVDRLAKKGTHLVGSEVTDLFALHGLPLQPMFEPQGELPPLDSADFMSPVSYEISAAKRARQINAYYSQLGEGLLEYVGPIVETSAPSSNRESHPTSGVHKPNLAKTTTVFDATLTTEPQASVNGKNHALPTEPLGAAAHGVVKSPVKR